MTQSAVSLRSSISMSMSKADIKCPACRGTGSFAEYAGSKLVGDKMRAAKITVVRGPCILKIEVPGHTRVLDFNTGDDVVVDFPVHYETD